MENSSFIKDLSDIPDNFKTNLPHQIKLEKNKQDKNNFINI